MPEQALGESASGYLEAFGSVSDAVGALTEQIAEVGDASEYAKEKSEEAFSAIGESAYHQIGTIAAGSFDAYADAMDTAISTGEFSAKSLGAALRNMLAQTLRSIGQEAAVKAAFQVAEGVASLANPATAWMAPGHFLAATQYVGVAALAGAGAGALSTGSGGSRREGPRSADTGDEDVEESISQVVTIIGGLDTRDAENLNDQLAAARKKRDLS